MGLLEILLVLAIIGKAMALVPALAAVSYLGLIGYYLLGYLALLGIVLVFYLVMALIAAVGSLLLG